MHVKNGVFKTYTENKVVYYLVDKNVKQAPRNLTLDLPEEHWLVLPNSVFELAL